MRGLQNKVVVVTGANSPQGIGYATAQRFIEHGARVIITGRRAEAVASAATSLGTNAKGYVCDISSMPQITQFVNDIVSEYGKIDVVFNNAGIVKLDTVKVMNEQDFDAVMDINFKGTFFLTQRLIPHISDGGSILFNTSIASFIGWPRSSIYAASKAALTSFSRVLAVELGPRRIRVNCIAPGGVYTDIQSKLGFDAATAEMYNKKNSARSPLGRMGQPAEIAGVACFLASDDASFITGVELPVDGGYLCHVV